MALFVPLPANLALSNDTTTVESVKYYYLLLRSSHWAAFSALPPDVHFIELMWQQYAVVVVMVPATDAQQQNRKSNSYLTN